MYKGCKYEQYRCCVYPSYYDWQDISQISVQLRMVRGRKVDARHDTGVVKIKEKLLTYQCQIFFLKKLHLGNAKTVFKKLCLHLDNSSLSLEKIVLPSRKLHLEWTSVHFDFKEVHSVLREVDLFLQRSLSRINLWRLHLTFKTVQLFLSKLHFGLRRLLCIQTFFGGSVKTAAFSLKSPFALWRENLDCSWSFWKSCSLVS